MENEKAEQARLKSEQEFSKKVDAVSGFIKKMYPHACKVAGRIKEHMVKREPVGKANPT